MRIVRPTRREVIAYGSAALASQARPPLADLAKLRSLSFIVVGDWGRDGAFHQRQVANAMSEFRDSAFVVTTGDNFYQRGVRSISDRKWETSFERIYSDVPQRWYAVLGNHDYGGSVEAQIAKTFHHGQWRMPDYWYDMRLDAFGRPDIHLFFINTIVWRGREKFPFNLLGSSVGKKEQRQQLDWLQSGLRSSNAPLKIVFGHHPIYSVRTQGSYYGMADLDALLFDHGVTAYVNGHDHCMYHISAPDWRNRAAGSMHYICSGAGSQMRPVYPDCVPQGLVTQSNCFGPEMLGSRRPYWHGFFTEKPEQPAIDLKGGFALFEVKDRNLNVSFIEPVADQAAGRPWRKRYSAAMPIRGSTRQV